MYFDILVLRVLADGARHGYEIKKQVEKILGGRSINNNVLYPALRRFEEQGAIERVAAEADPGRPPRNVYRLSDTGHDMLQAMIRDADPLLLADENEFQTRVAFFGDLEPAERREILRVRREIVESRIAHSVSLRPEAAHSRWALQVIDFNLERMHHALAWLDMLAAVAESTGAAQDAAGEDGAGKDGAGKDAAGKDGAGKDAAGEDAAGAGATGEGL
jgi:DNA-binding PadR family transcriptional regulator